MALVSRPSEARDASFTYVMRSLLLLLLIVQGNQCLRDVRLRVPVAVRSGESLPLSCDFTLEHELLYSVKFYKGDTELYRFVPQESPPTRVFPLDGVSVDISRSNSSTVTLTHVNRHMTGFYQCEVSADAPFFHTGIQKTHVTITEEPWALPAVMTEKSRYNMGEKIRANCTSQGGYPPANLTWYINGQKVLHTPTVAVLYHTVQGARTEDPETAVLRLEVEATPLLFPDGRLRLRCEAAQFSLYQRIAQLDLLEDTPRLAPVLGPTATHHEANAGMTICLDSNILLFLATLCANALMLTECLKR
ncbi:uncharacterized protein LOC124366609 [Homalodisca vitripennis]|uniref:uncharacterized protein LOC124366609 n=1 Tax=Homalodisca vitripennis TaxID=197043 RepID=UPI001EEA3B3F|nr:uncharacterized protein LOC124366609 [Homalodisca vitripennis]